MKKVECKEGIDIKLPNRAPMILDDGRDPMFWFMVSIICLQITVLIFTFIQ